MNDVLPEILDQTRHGDACITLSLRVSASNPLFAGHFPGFPVVPGVALVHWAASLGQRHLPVHGIFGRLLSLKFHRVIVPDTTLSLSLEWSVTRRQLNFEYASSHGRHASGGLEFAGEQS